MALLPLPLSESPWSPNIRNAFRELSSNYATIHGYVNTSSVESHRLAQYCEIIMTSTFPLLLLLEETSVTKNLPLFWLEDTANKFVELLALLDENLKAVSGR